MRMKRFNRILPLLVRCALPLLASALLFSCSRAPANQFAPFQERSASALQPSPEGIESLRKLLEDTQSRAAIVLFRGQIIAEWYWKDAQAETVFEVWSATKSFASACVGLLIDDGKISSPEDLVSKFIPSWSAGEKAEISLDNLLLQNSGLRESAGFLGAKNQVQAALEADIVTTPGAVTRYNNAGCNVLAPVIAAASGEDPEAYLRRRLLQPIGMTHTRWRRDAAGNVMTYAGLQTTARDLARFGQLFLNKGKWGRKQILSAEWIAASTTPHTVMRFGNMQVGPYGYLWWLDQAIASVPHNFSALGMFGNNLTVIPEQDLVAVRLVGTDNAGMPLMFMLPRWVEAVSKTVE